MRATYLIYGFSVAMLAVATSASFAQDKPKPAAKAEPTDPKTLDLRLDAGSVWKRHESVRGFLHISLGNKTKEVREVPEIRAVGNQLFDCEDITFVIRFENGLTVERQSGVMMYVAGGGRPTRHPVALPAGGYIVDKSTILEALDNHHEFQKYAGRGQPFTVTAICRKLKLRSNTLYINNYPIPAKGKEHDPFKDADDFHARERFEALNLPKAPPPRPVMDQ